MPDVAATVRMGYVTVLQDYFIAQGFDLANLSGDDWHILSAQNDLAGRIPVERYARLMERAIAVTGDPALPIRLAEYILPRHLGILGAAILHCANLGEAAQLLQRYERLIDDINDAHFSVDARRASIEWISRIARPPIFFMQKSMAVWVAFARRISGQSGLVADVSFPFPKPVDIKPYQAFFRGEVQFGAARSLLSFDAEYLELPLQLHESQSHDLLLQRLHQQYELEVTGGSLIGQIRQTVRRQLGKGHASLDSVAVVMKMTPRTLQNRLQSQGLRFRDLLEDERFRLAEAYLRDPSITLAEVAFLLGYSEQSPFQNAFKRRYGMAPGEFRRQTGLS